MTAPTYTLTAPHWRALNVAAAPAVLACLAGRYVNRDAWQPCPDAVAAALPHRWRKAFSRGPLWWFERDGEGPAHMTLRDRRGKAIVTIYANVSRED